MTAQTAADAKKPQQQHRQQLLSDNEKQHHQQQHQQQQQEQEVEFDDSLAFQPADGGWVAWLVCFTSFCTNGTIFSIINSFGIISDWLIHNFGTAKSVAGSIGSATIGCVFFFSFLGSVVMDRIGIRKCAFAGAVVCSASFVCSSFVGSNVSLLFFTHSFLFGFGASLVYTPSLVILGHHFERHLGIANGLVTLGSGVFSVILSKLLKPVLLDRLGLGNTFRVYFCLTALLFAYILCWKPKRPIRHSELDHYLSSSSMAERAAGCKTFLAKFFNVSIWRNRGFVVWIVGCPLALFGYFVPFVFLPNFVQERTMAKLLAANGSETQNATQLEAAAHSQAESDSALLLICINVASGVARIIVGKLADVRCVNRVYLQQVAFFVLGVSISLFPLCYSLGPMVALSLVFGACDGAFVCMIGPIAFDLVGPTGASQAIGFLLQLMSLPTTTGPLLTGLINDSTGRWDIPFYISGSSPIIGSLVMLLIPRIRQAYPAATVADGLDQMTKSNLDIQGYSAAPTDPSGVWQKAPTASLSSLVFRSSQRLQPEKPRSLTEAVVSCDAEPPSGCSSRSSSSSSNGNSIQSGGDRKKKQEQQISSDGKAEVTTRESTI